MKKTLYTQYSKTYLQKSKSKNKATSKDARKGMGYSYYLHTKQMDKQIDNKNLIITDPAGEIHMIIISCIDIFCTGYGIIKSKTEYFTMKDIDFCLYNAKNPLSHVIVKNNTVTVENFTNSRLFTPFLIENVTTDTVMSFFNDRCFESSRPDKNKLLEKLGLDSYDSIEICKKTHGMMAEDHCWIKFKGEGITYEELFD